MNYVFRCVRCDKPALPVSKKVGWTVNGFATVKKTIPKQCDCGGEVKSVIE